MAQTRGAQLARGLPGLAAFNHLFAYLYCMLASTAILSRPVLGGALYMIGQVTVLFSRLMLPGDFRRLPRGLRRAGLVLGILAGVLALGMVRLAVMAASKPVLIAECLNARASPIDVWGMTGGCRLIHSSTV